MQKHLYKMCVVMIILAMLGAVGYGAYLGQRERMFRMAFWNRFHIAYSETMSGKRDQVRERVIGKLCEDRNLCLAGQKAIDTLEARRKSLIASFTTPGEAEECIRLADEIGTKKEFLASDTNRFAEEREMAYQAGFKEEAELMGYHPTKSGNPL